MDGQVTHLQITSSGRFDLRGNPYPIMQYSYFIGAHGPFVDEYKLGDDTPEAVKAGFQKRIDHLTAIGAIGRVGY
jgi:hypothetical protein